MQVSEVMERSVEFIAPDECVREAAVLMGELDVGALPVGTADDLQGIVTDRDILLRVVAEGRDPTKTRVRDAMSSTVFTCHEADSLAAAMDMMASYHVRRMPVADATGVVIGWLSLADISRCLLEDSEVVAQALAELSQTGDPPQAAVSERRDA